VRNRETACIVEMPVERIRAPDVVDDPQQQHGWKSTKGTYGTVKSDASSHDVCRPRKIHRYTTYFPMSDAKTNHRVGEIM
jgi:hypothetical protein